MSELSDYDLYDKHIPLLDEDFTDNNSFIKQFLNWVKNCQYSKNNVNTNVNNNKYKKEDYYSYIITGPSGCGKTHLINQILNNHNIKKEKLNFQYLKQILLKSNDEENIDENNISDNYVKQILINIVSRSGIMKFINNYDNNSMKIILINDDEKNNFMLQEKKIIMKILNINDKYKICPLLFIFNDEYDKFVNLISKKSYMCKIAAPSDNKIKKFITKLNKLNNVIMSENIIDNIIDICNNNYKLLKKNYIELIKYYSKKKNNQYYITDEILDKFMSTKFINIDNTLLFNKCNDILFNYTSDNLTMKYFYSEKILLPSIVNEYALVKINKSNMSLEKKKEILKKYSKYASTADIIDNYYNNNQQWSLIKHHGYYSCCLTGQLMDKVNCNIKLKYEFPKNINKLSMQKINKNHIIDNYYIFHTKDINIYMYLIPLLYQYIKQKDTKRLNELIDNYNLNLKIIDNVFKIDKFSNYILTNEYKKKFIKK